MIKYEKFVMVEYNKKWEFSVKKSDFKVCNTTNKFGLESVVVL